MTYPRFRLTPPPKPKLREKHVADACLHLLRLRGWFPIRTPSGLYKTLDDRKQTIGTPGQPDYVCLHKQYPGFFLETKRPGGKLSPGQKTKHSELREAYGLTVATIDCVEALIPWLDEYEDKKMVHDPEPL